MIPQTSGLPGTRQAKGARRQRTALSVALFLLSAVACCGITPPSVNAAFFGEASALHRQNRDKKSAPTKTKSSRKPLVGKPIPVPKLDVRTIWRNSMRAGQDVPMRARMSLTIWRKNQTVAVLGEKVLGSGGRYRITYAAPPDARGRVVCFDGHDTWQYEPRQKLLTRTQGSSEANDEEKDAARESLLTQNYTLALLSANDSAGGRPCYLLEIKPRHKGKGRERRWVDIATGHLLRSETYFADGSLSRVLSYQHVTLPAPVAETEFTLKVPADTRIIKRGSTVPRQSPEELTRLAARVGFEMEGPLGFRLSRVTTTRISHKENQVLFYSDGMESVSIFVLEEASLPIAPAGNWRRIPMHGLTAYLESAPHSNVLTWLQYGKRFTAISDLEPDALLTFISAQTKD